MVWIDLGVHKIGQDNETGYRVEYNKTGANNISWISCAMSDGHLPSLVDSS